MAVPASKRSVIDFEKSLDKTKQTTLQLPLSLRKDISSWRCENKGSQADVLRWGSQAFLLMDEFIKGVDPDFKLHGDDKGIELFEKVLTLIGND